MLLKISDGSGGWTLLDNVDRVHISSLHKEIRTADDLSNIKTPGENERVVLISKDCFPLKNGRGIDTGILEVVRGGKLLSVIYTDVTYVCDDRGNTMEKVVVR
jgi:hypothetical protein